MKLYHYTALHLAVSIARTGIRLGHIPNMNAEGNWYIMPGYTCLTANPDHHAQEWAIGQRIPYDRNSVRFTVELPDEHAINWLEFCDSGGIREAAAKQLNAFGDVENWYLSRVHIPVEWIVARDARPPRNLIMFAR